MATVMQQLRRYWFRLRRGLETHGVLAVAALAAGRVFSIDVEHVWYALDLEGVEPLTLAAGYYLHRGTQEDAELLRELPAVPVEEGQRRVADGVQLWFVLKEREPAFVCFCFLERFRLEAARGGWYELPDGVACLENSLASPKHRGHGIAPSAWAGIAASLRDDGFEVLITRAEIGNVAVRRALEKIGFRAAGVMHRSRRGVRSRIDFRDESAELTEAERAAVADLREKTSAATG
jgi:RimJ/RimL family protein N-acetyltransferase